MSFMFPNPDAVPILCDYSQDGDLEEDVDAADTSSQTPTPSKLSITHINQQGLGITFLYGESQGSPCLEIGMVLFS